MDENELSHEVIGAAIGVDRIIGQGLLEFIYEEALVIELDGTGLEVVRQTAFEVWYKDDDSKTSFDSISWSMRS